MKKIISLTLALLMLLSVFTITVNAAGYSNGTYEVTAQSGVNVRSGAGTGYGVVGASAKGTSFKVSKTNGSWGYTSSIKCTNGTKSGWVCLDYCKYKNAARTTYNDVFASLKGKGYSVNQARSSEATAFTRNSYIYVWGYIHDANGNLYNSYASGEYKLALSIYRPNGTCAFTYTYKNSDNNWIGCKVDQAGTWSIRSQVSGAINGTNTRTITVKSAEKTVYPTGISLSCTSCTVDDGSSKKISATVSPSNATDKSVSWSTSDSSVATVSGGVIYAKSPGYATITAKTSNGKTKSCSVTVRGLKINNIGALVAGDTDYLSVTAVPKNSTKYTWSSTNPSVISVNSSGKITAKAAGSATISVMSSDGRATFRTFTVASAVKWKTGRFDTGYVAKGYTTVKLNRNVTNGYMRIHTYDQLGVKSSGEIHVTLRDAKGNWICEFDTKSGSKLKLGNDHSEYRVYIAKKSYPNTIIGQGDDFINRGKCVCWGIECLDGSYIK